MIANQITGAHVRLDSAAFAGLILDYRQFLVGEPAAEFSRECLALNPILTLNKTHVHNTCHVEISSSIGNT